MGVTKFIKKICVQPAIYWGGATPDGYGGTTYTAPVQIYVRWQNKMKIVTDKDGKEITSSAEVLSPNRLNIQSHIMLGELKDVLVSAGVYKTPEQCDSFQIRSNEEIPLLKSTTMDVYTYFLSPHIR